MNKKFWGVNICESAHTFSSFSFVLWNQVASFLAFLTQDPSLIKNTVSITCLWSTYLPNSIMQKYTDPSEEILFFHTHA